MIYVMDVCAVMLTVAILLCLFRIVRGPTTVDRILAFDGIAICAMGLTVLLGVRWDTGFFIELFMIFSLLGFLGTVAFVFYLMKSMPRRNDRDE